MNTDFRKILVIQTASTGDVILATALCETLHRNFPDAHIDILLKKGNESLFDDHPYFNEVLAWDKRNHKYLNIWKLTNTIRRRRYNLVVNIQRFFSTGLVTVLAGANTTSGFRKNPFSFLFDYRAPHVIGDSATPVHETERNHLLIKSFVTDAPDRSRLYPQQKHFSSIGHLTSRPFICIAPGSLWFTKQFPAEKWIEFINQTDNDLLIYLLGGPDDKPLCEQLRKMATRTGIEVLAGSLSYLESAALMKQAVMNFVNDSAPLHLASAVNAPVTAVFCSTIPAFGFGPQSDIHFIVETPEKLECRPCGLHGRKTCPEKHFRCATTIDTNLLLDIVN